MALTFGFYNSSNGDRRYDSIQMSSIFDGIIRDGIFMSIGTSMMVKAAEGMMANIGIGRAWFNHTWSNNDAPYPIIFDQPEVLQDRIDTVVLEVNSQIAVRANSYKIIKGTPSTNPVPPTLIDSLSVNQYALCDVRIRRGVNSITQSDITNRVGLGRAPFVTGLLDVINIDSLVAQWGDQWKQFFDAQTLDMIRTAESWANQWRNFYESTTLDMTNTSEAWKAQWRAWFDSTTENANTENANWREERGEAFETWFQSLQAMLAGNVEANMAAEILALKNRMSVVEDFKNTLSNEFKVIHNIQDSNGNNILDSIGREIEGQIIFCIKPCCK